VTLNELVFYGVSQLAQGIRDRRFSATEVPEAYLAQIARHNPTLNTIVILNESQARLQAQAADRAVATVIVAWVDVRKPATDLVFLGHGFRSST
jgi:Asp-tRNA(Asn)/Glu-tRNA(Gln) amidotransferase A subunit family amidase